MFIKSKLTVLLRWFCISRFYYVYSYCVCNLPVKSCHKGRKLETRFGDIFSYLYEMFHDSILQINIYLIQMFVKALFNKQKCSQITQNMWSRNSVSQQKKPEQKILIFGWVMASAVKNVREYVLLWFLVRDSFWPFFFESSYFSQKSISLDPVSFAGKL